MDRSFDYLVTGAAGFIGYHVAKKLLSQGHSVMGLDNLNPYYDVSLKIARLDQLRDWKSFKFVKADISDRSVLDELFRENSFLYVIHLAAQAGVRYSLENPYAYVDSNVVGFVNVLEGMKRQSHLKHVVFASSSSVYGANTVTPFSESDRVDQPVNLYAATKKANEMIAYSYSHLFGLPLTGLRFFTVYGPWGRPDMALFKFTKAILEGKSISVFNHGKMKRDFTYIDDVVSCVYEISKKPPARSDQFPPYELFNFGNSQPVDLMQFVHTLEKVLGKEAIVHFEPLQPGDVPETFSDTSKLESRIGTRPRTSFENGISQFVKWYLEYFHANHSEEFVEV